VGRLIYTAIASLDGYVADETGNFDWAAPDEELHRFVNDVERPARTHLYGRRMYEALVAWENPEIGTGQPAFIQDFAAIWRSADKIIYSRTLKSPSSERTRIERSFVPEGVRTLKAESRSDITIGGPHLAAEAIRAGLVDDIHLFLVPVLVGGGNRALPDGVRLDLELRDERRFKSGVVHVQYRTHA